MIVRWNATDYHINAHFVSALGQEVVELLDPQPHEHILDVGCGDGTLAQFMSKRGAKVRCIDSSPDMLAAAQQKGIEISVLDAQQLTFEHEFDAVFSNAALHWMLQPDAVLQGIYRALKRPGRFVGELGGKGNLHTIITAIADTLQRRGLHYADYDPWYFPTAEEYQTRMEGAGFRVKYIKLFRRPTPLPTGILGWLQTFAAPFLKDIPTNEQPQFLEEVSTHMAPTLQQSDGSWQADYVRCRFWAVKE